MNCTAVECQQVLNGARAVPCGCASPCLTWLRPYPVNGCMGPQELSHQSCSFLSASTYKQRHATAWKLQQMSHATTSIKHTVRSNQNTSHVTTSSKQTLTSEVRSSGGLGSPLSTAASSVLWGAAAWLEVELVRLCKLPHKREGWSGKLLLKLVWKLLGWLVVLMLGRDPYVWIHRSVTPGWALEEGLHLRHRLGDLRMGSLA